MLKTLDPLLGPELLHALASMGHGDEIAIVDANFPAAACARRLLRIDGASATRVAQAVLSLLPLDDFVAAPLVTMEVVDKPDEVPGIVGEFRQAAADAEGRPVAASALPREAFYTRAREAFAVVQSGETRLYGNLLLRKGVLRPPPGAGP
ncbi:RbsD/FucU domain-containing protein [Variovorax sp. J22P271]|uniref:RbsD/FucU family protein n=1 Tax=Variovorax davisae TaxID=3053515 RepID=UPI002574ED9B|nr:RbsD/FucU domain-containing protein [Variovorax sp. J22P271]MDM0034529.1 RbsD/FucU domain-containing protein [Variovorax sp. J22P271]